MPGEPRVLSADSRPELLDRVHALLDEVWEEHHGVGARDRVALTTAVAEVAANVVEHAATDAVVPVRLEVRVDEALLVAVLEDLGSAYPGDSASPEDPMAETGRGLAMARALCEELTYERHGALNRWRLVRRRG